MDLSPREKDKLLITAVDKHYWKYLHLFPKGTKLVIHLEQYLSKYLSLNLNQKSIQTLPFDFLLVGHFSKITFVIIVITTNLFVLKLMISFVLALELVLIVLYFLILQMFSYLLLNNLLDLPNL